MKSKLYPRLLAITLIAFSLNAQGDTAVESDPVTFTGHVASVIFNNCSSCHRPNEAGPFSLLNYRDVQKRGKLILSVVEDRYMPPWHVESKHYEFQDHRRLSDEQISLIRRWVKGGMPEGDPSKLPAMPEFTDGWQLGEPDLVVSMKEGYTLYAEGPDIYRNFVIPLNLEEDKWIQAIEFRPGERSVVHHSLFYFDTSGQAQAQDAADPVPGFKRMGRSVRDGSLGGWAVGGIPKKLPEGLAYFLPKEADLILSTHFHPSGKEETEVSTVGLYFSEEPPNQKFTAIQLPPSFGALAGVRIPPGDSHYTKTDSFVLPVDVKAFSVSSHAHYLGKTMNLSATLPDGSEKELMSIPEWSFSWQEQYRYKDYVFLPAGTRLDGEVVWDNSTENINNPNNPPKMVRWGRESTDEMGSVTLRVVAADPSEFNQLRDEYRSHVREASQGAGKRRFSENRGTRGKNLIKGIIERFDADGDGKLNSAEREAAKKAFGR